MKIELPDVYNSEHTALTHVFSFPGDQQVTIDLVAKTNFWGETSQIPHRGCRITRTALRARRRRARLATLGDLLQDVLRERIPWLVVQGALRTSLRLI
jgi:hypothetical protein